MIFYVCKMCGRSLRAEEKPTYCYFDRMDQMENISDEDAEKMGLFSQIRSVFPIIVKTGQPYFSPEFGGDVRFDPFTGDPLIYEGMQQTLSDFQDVIMKKVIGGNLNGTNP